MQPAFPIGHRAVDLGPVRIGMAPEGSPPGMVQIIQRLVLFLQPFPEGLLALRTMTGCIGSVSAVFIGDMPQDNARMISQMPGQLMVNLFHFLSHNRRGVTEVMPSPRKMRTPSGLICLTSSYFAVIQLGMAPVGVARMV